MNRTIYRMHYAVLGAFFALTLGSVPWSLGQQALPPLVPVDVPNFTIPFEIGESAHSVREVELLVSKDRGRRWLAVDRQPVESGKFAFRADSNGEHWFAFRTTSAAGNVAPINGQPQLRVLVNVNEPMILLPSQPSEPGPLTPPKPERFRTGNEPKLQSQPKQPPQPTLSTNVDVSESSESLTEPEGTGIDESTQILAPKLPGLELSKRQGDHERNLLDDLLSRMSPFMDVQPTPVRNVSTHGGTPGKSSVPPNTSTDSKSPVDPQAGGITGIVLNNTTSGSQIVVRWDPGLGFWQDAQIDVLRSNTQEGPWSPIAINLPNSGEYWWFLTPEDLKPFYVAVRIRSVEGGIQMDVTKSVITIDPRLSQFPKPHS